MKNVGFGLILFVSIVLTIATVFSVNHKSNRDNEMKNALDVAIENTMDNLKTDRIYTIANTDEFIADFAQDLLIQIDSDSSVDIVIKEANIDAGLLSVEVTMHYQYSNGKDGHVSTERTVIFEHR